MKCKLGDLALVIDAVNPENIGRIVSVVRLQNNEDELKIQDLGIIWHVKSFDKLFWSIGNAMYEACSGPVPDNFYIQFVAN
jgi:hypothetical protein